MLQLHFRIFLILVPVNGMISGNSNLDGCHAVVFVPKQTTHFNRRLTQVVSKRPTNAWKIPVY
jgi:hypothetical protein